MYVQLGALGNFERGDYLLEILYLYKLALGRMKKYRLCGQGAIRFDNENYLVFVLSVLDYSCCRRLPFCVILAYSQTRVRLEFEFLAGRKHNNGYVLAHRLYQFILGDEFP